MNKIDRMTRTGDRGTTATTRLADFKMSKAPKEREGANSLLTYAAIKLAEIDSRAVAGRMESPTEYMKESYKFFEAHFPSRPFAFQKKSGSYRKHLVPKFSGVISERFVGLPKHKQQFMPRITKEARCYYLDVLIAAVRSDLEEFGHQESLVLLCMYVNLEETTRDTVAAYIGRPAISLAIAEAQNFRPRVYQLLSGWNELFHA